MKLSAACGLLLVLLAATVRGVGAPPPVGTHTLTAGEVTITYPDGLEAQAQELAALAAEVVPPRQAQLQQVSTTLGDTTALAKQIGTLLGSSKAEKKCRESLKRWPAQHYDQLMYSTLHHWRLYRQAELRASGTFTDGAITVLVDPATGKMGWRLEAHFTDGKPTGSLDGFMPFAVDDAGKILFSTTQPSLTADITSSLESWIPMRMGVIHEVTEEYLLNDAKLGHPYTRWFNEGVATWVMYTIAAQAMPEAKPLFAESYLPKLGDPLRGKVNLPAWPQAMFTIPAMTEEEKALEVTTYRCATEFIRQCLDEQPAGALPKILKALEKTPRPDTATICRAIAGVTKKDVTGLLQYYIPAQVREDVQERRAESYFAIGKRVNLGNYPQCVNLLTLATHTEPVKPAPHLYLAWALRKLGDHREEAEQEIKLACALGLAENDYLQFAVNDDDEVAYIRARIAQCAGDTKTARALYQNLLAKNPQHADAQAGLAEVGKK